MKVLSILFAFWLLPQLQGQQVDLEVSLQPIEIKGFGGIQSFAYGTWKGNWLIVGGRLDGLHMKQPWASFHPDGSNKVISIIDPKKKKTWKLDLNNLALSLQDQLSSSNMQFYQEQETLYLIGGYGYSQEEDAYITFPYLTAINLPQVIKAVKNKTSIHPHIRQIQDKRMAVTGGGLEKIGAKYYLVGGQKFTGRYNPHGPDHGPGFTQEYTHEIRTFQIVNEKEKLIIAQYQAQHDAFHLRRRDYNLVPQISNGKEGLMLFSGVFQPKADLPWLYPIAINEDGYHPMENKTQAYNHYHCAHIPIYFEEQKEMQTLFLGGIAQYYHEDQMMVQDNEIPFTNTIASITRTPRNPWQEQKLNTEMPSYLGASAEFIPSEKLAQYSNGVIKGGEILGKELLVGYIVGGIKSDAPNIFWINDGSQSIASPTIFEVYLKAKIRDQNKQLAGLVKYAPLSIYPRSDGSFSIKINGDILPTHINIYQENEGLVASTKKNEISPFFTSSSNSPLSSGTYLIDIYYEDEKVTQKLIVK